MRSPHRPVRVMSALPPMADIRQCGWDVREVPQADMIASAVSESRGGSYSPERPVGLSCVEELAHIRRVWAPLTAMVPAWPMRQELGKPSFVFDFLMQD